MQIYDVTRVNSPSISIAQQTDKPLFKQGERLSASVVSVDGRSVSLKLDDGSTLLASRSANEVLRPGDSVTLEVDSSTASSAKLRLAEVNSQPVMPEVSREQAALMRASYQMAPSAATDMRTLERLSIPASTQTLSRMAQIRQAAPSLPPARAALLASTDIPVNINNIKAFSSWLDSPVSASVLANALSEFSVADPSAAKAVLEAFAANTGTAAAGNAGAGAAGATATGTMGADAGATATGAAGAAGATATGTMGADAGATATGAAGADAGATATGATGADAGATAAGAAGADAGATATGAMGADAGATATGATGADAGATATGAMGADAGATAAGRAASSGPFEAAFPSTSPPLRVGFIRGRLDAGAADTVASPVGRVPLNPPPSDALTPAGAQTSPPLKRVLGELFLKLSEADGAASARGEAVKEAVVKLPQSVARLESALTDAASRSQAAQPSLQASSSLASQLSMGAELGGMLYAQIPLRSESEHSTAELYIVKRDRGAKSIDDANATVALCIETENLGRVESLIHIEKNDLTLRFRVETQREAKFIKSRLNELRALDFPAQYTLRGASVALAGEPLTLDNAARTLQKEFALRDAAKGIDIQV